MDARVAAELLYESEATLRMVDNALDELRVADDDEEETIVPPARMQALSAEAHETHGVDVPPEFCVRAYWQVQEVADCLRESRELIRSVQGTVAPQHELAEQQGRLDRILSLVDRLDSDEATLGSGDRALLSQLRTEIVAILEHSNGSEGAVSSLSLAASYLAEAEGRLTKLGHVFDSHDF